MNDAYSLLLPLAVTGSFGVPATVALFIIPLVLGIFLFLLIGTLRDGLARHGEQVASEISKLDSQVAKIAASLEAIQAQSDNNTRRLEDAISGISIAAASSAATGIQGSLPETQVTSNGSESEAPSLVTANGQVQETYDEGNFDKALELLRNMEEDHPANLLAARQLFERELNGPRQAEAYTYLSEVMFWLGELATTNSEKEQFHGEGVAFGKQSVALSDNDVAAHLWYAANMGAHGMARGIMSSLFYLGDIEKHGSRAIELDETFFHAAPLRLMGRFYHQCPGWPIGKGDTAKAIKMLETAVKLGPDFLMNHYYLADVYLAKRKKGEARKVLDDMLARDTYALLPKYMKSIQADGKQLLRKT